MVNSKNRETENKDGESSHQSLSYLNFTQERVNTIIVSKLILKTPEKIENSIIINNISSIKIKGSSLLGRVDPIFEEKMEEFMKSSINKINFSDGTISKLRR